MKRIIAAIAIVTGLGMAAHAADAKYEVGAGLSGVIPLGDFQDAADPSLGVTAYGDYKLNSLFTAGLEGAYAFGHESKANSSVDYLCTTIGLRGRYVRDLGYGIRAYGILGLASYTWSTDPDSSLDTTKVGVNFGAGADVEVMPNWLTGIELRYHAVKTGGINGNHLVPTLKVGYTF